MGLFLFYFSFSFSLPLLFFNLGFEGGTLFRFLFSLI